MNNNKEVSVELQLSDISGGVADSPSGVPSNFEEVEVEEVITYDEDNFDFRNIVTITGYLHDKIEVAIKWNEECYESYKNNEEVKVMIHEGEKIIVDSLKHMASID